MPVPYGRGSARSTTTPKLEGYPFLLFQKVGLYLQTGGCAMPMRQGPQYRAGFPNEFARGLLLASKNNHVLVRMIGMQN